MDLKELKAKAYDLLAQIQHLQRELNEVNGLIFSFQQKDAKEAPPEPGKKQAP